MKNKLIKDSSGIAHLGLIIIIVLVVGVVGFGTYRVIDANKADTVTTELTDQDVENTLDDEENSTRQLQRDVT